MCRTTLTHIFYVAYWHIGGEGSLGFPKTLMEIIFNPCGEFQWSSESPVSQIHSPHLYVGAPGIFSDLLKSVQMLKGESGVRKATGKLPRLYLSLVKCNLGSWVCSRRSAFGQNCNLGSCVCSERPTLGRILCWWWWYRYISPCNMVCPRDVWIKNGSH